MLNGSIKGTKLGWWSKDLVKTLNYYLGNFAPTAKINIVRIILALVVTRGWELDRLDMRKGLLNGDLVEEVYMTCPLHMKNKGKVVN